MISTQCFDHTGAEARYFTCRCQQLSFKMEVSFSLKYQSLLYGEHKGFKHRRDPVVNQCATGLVVIDGSYDTAQALVAE